MTDNMKRSQDPVDVQDLQFKKCGTSQIFEPFSLPVNSNNLIVTDGKRGFLYIGHHKTLTLLKPAVDDVPESKLDIELPDFVSYVAINCDCSYLAIAYSQPSVFIYDASVLHKRNLVPIAELRITTALEPVQLLDLRWSPTSPNMLCTISSDHSIGSFQVKTDSQLPPTKLSNLEALCAVWSPKGKQLAIGCRNGNIVQLKPDLTVMRTIVGPVQSLGEIIALLWISNYQFCAAYHDAPTQTITAAIVDAPKNTAATFTCYDSLLIRMPEDNMKPRFYFEHIAEWGMIIVTTNDSAESAVIGTNDGTNWVQWIMESNARAELPMVKKKDSYPLGFTVDRTPRNKIQLDPENVANLPFPILHILGTSGLLISFHIVNLKPKCPDICMAPTEIVTLANPLPPAVSNPMTFSPNVGSAPTVRQTEAPTNLFASPTFAKPAEILQFQAKMNFGTEPQKVGAPPKSTPFFGTGQKVVETKNVMPPPAMELPKTTGFPLQREPSQIELPKAPEPVIPETRPEPAKEPQQTVPKAKPEKKYDDAIYLKAYRDELAYFEKELENRREYVFEEVGTEDEKQLLVNKALMNEDQLVDMTEALMNDLRGTRSQLLQTFTALVEARSRISSSSSVGERNKNENSKIKARKNSIHHFECQIHELNMALDLKRAEQRKSENEHAMNIPNLEFLYMTLLRQGQLVNRQQINLEEVAKKVKAMGKKNLSIASLNQSLSNLNVSVAYEYGIDKRCKAIATNEKNFSRQKKCLLRDLLLETEPRTIKPANLAIVQDRLNATLTSLATSSKPNEKMLESQPKPRVQLQPKVHQPPAQQVLQQTQSPLPSLNNLVSRLGSEVAPLQSSFQMAPPTTPKVSSFSPVGTQALPKLPTASMTSGLLQSQSQALPSFPKLDSLKFSTSTPMKPTEPVKEAAKPAELQPKDNKGFPNFSMKPVSPSTETVPKPVHKSFVSQKPVFGTTAQPGTTNLFGAKPAGTFSFGAATATPPTATQASQPALQSTLSLGGLSMGLQQPEFSVTSVQTTSAAAAPVMPSPLVFKTPQTSLFAKTVPATTSSPSSIASGMVITPAFCRSTTTSVTTAVSPDKITSSAPATTTTSVTAAQSVFNFASQPVITASSTVISSPPNTTSAGSMFGSAAAPTSIASAAETKTATTTAPSVFSFLSGAMSAATSTTSTSGTATTTTTSVFSGAGLGEILSASTGLDFGALSTSATTSPPAFSAKTTEAPPMFGAKTTTTSSGDNLFSKAAAEGGPVTFGSLTITPTSSSPSMFGGSSAVAASTTSTTVTATTATPLFGGATATLSSTLGTPFGASSTTSVTSPFTATSTTPFGTTAAPSTGLFSATNSTPAFGTTTATTTVPNASTFGSLPAFSTASPVFGAATSSAPSFGSGAVFGSPATTNAAFGSPTSTASQPQAFGSIFANANAANTSAASPFGSKTSGGASASMFGGTAAPAFGSPAQVSMFGDAAKAQTPVFGSSGAGIFGSVNQPASPLGAGMMGAATSPVFGQTATFGAKPVFGAPSTPVFGGGFGSPTFGGNQPNAGFGSPPSMGASLPQMGSPGTMDKVFGGGGGTNTFESLASQSGGLSFGSLAQKPAEPQPAPTFTGGSSFSSWR